MKDRIRISDDITLVVTESGEVFIYSRMADTSVQLNHDEQRGILEWLKQHLEGGKHGKSELRAGKQK